MIDPWLTSSSMGEMWRRCPRWKVSRSPTPNRCKINKTPLDLDRQSWQDATGVLSRIARQLASYTEPDNTQLGCIAMTEGESKRLEEWRKFELFISAIEAALAPKGAVVQSPDRIADKISGQLREVDASIRFQVGSTPILITIECRDRVGIQDVTWIEQLAKKKENIGASVTVAVSSSGFTEPALRVASQVGIETRTLTDVSDTDAGKWIDGICISVEFRQWRFTRIEVVLLGAPPNVQLSSTLTEQIQTRGYEAAIAYRQGDGQPLILGDLGGQFVQHGMYPPLPE